MAAKKTPVTGRVDQTHMRASNMSLILRHLRTAGASSRARLAAETGLSKSTMSSVISDLTERGLVCEGAPDRTGSVGRPGLLVSIDGALVAGLGIEINVDYLAMTALDLAGRVIRESTTPIAVKGLPVETVMDRVAALARRTLASLRDAGCFVVALKIATTGVIDYRAGIVRFAPNLGWRDVHLIDELARRLGDDVPPIQIESDAKFAAVAEYAGYASQGVEDLLYLTGDVGVGAGIIAGGRLVRGWSGFSGEVGHMPLDPQRRPCACGRSGCWELMVGLPALLSLVDPEGTEFGDASRPLEDSLDLLRRRAAAGERRTLEALATITADLATGLSVIVDVLNPQVVVLGGYFAYFGDQILEPLAEALQQRRMDEGSSVQLAVSAMGITTASRGAAQAAIEGVYADPTLMPTVV